MFRAFDHDNRKVLDQEDWFETLRVNTRWVMTIISQILAMRYCGSTVFTLKILITEELIRAILSYGGEIEVLAPESLRQTIRQRAKLVASLYK